MAHHPQRIRREPISTRAPSLQKGRLAGAAGRGQNQAVVCVTEDRLALQRRDQLLGQGLAREVDHFISNYRTSENRDKSQ